VRQIDGVLHNVDLVFELGGDVDSRVGNHQGARVGRVSMIKTWLMRRAVRNPVSRAMAAFISSSVCKLPFIMARALPERHMATPSSAALLPFQHEESGRRDMSKPILAASSFMAASSRSA